ncbi:tryptophan--tRNA ligase [Clostridium tyrobutyricum]|jgi:tryptophanyl-tRNA synthetase|uniref:Tryptophan--tRNA ligase n=1 Tax=Clostridium tyrobutyricum DIVETGP TaxID=1408889 RepID=W6N959_CLOTY|nr:tryptophan--tRNA ligase [Clostridium tyrobutyricum]AND85928.1 tryptophanyl-tRNA synthetase [Clostridium tyrobutyricum]ANP70438.1 tryptophan--tRNA ligase [Clostridium tyrobutyricum]MBR9647519.1 tryptophan--tRNA ligase [Clostridium tyrobutyricum]MBV4414704.1 tryptophan--tRNA ligase [Clostridium tyrobutyricum]MBV4423125.1 tryptophan--tRNA ligase [Clostridium tyrobutyricum]
MEEKKKIIFSGIQPSGNLTIGNYLGALKNWVKLQDKYDCYFCVVDLHAITVRQQPKDLRRRTLEVLAIYLAAGIDPERNTIFIQSHVPTHCEAAWLLNCFTYVGELSRMTQYKNKSQKYSDSGDPISAGLLNYPVLMAADILLYNADLVPVGKDQTQHIELTRDIAQRFNNIYSPTFTIPEGYIPESGAKVMDLQEPTKKMSKSSGNPNSFILIMDPPEVIRRKINRCVTDSIGKVKYSDDQPGIKNLINILIALQGTTAEEVEKKYENLGYAEFKNDVAEAIVQELKPIQDKVKHYLENKYYLEEIYKKGAEKAHYVSNKVLRKMQKKIGFIPPAR